MEEEDPLDVAATAQRPVAPSGRRRVVRRVRPKADATEEVQVEDILLEVYAEEPPPPMTRRSGGFLAAPARPATPATPAESAAVDALLRASAPAFLPQFPALPPVPFAASVPLHLGADYESPSVAPVMLATTTPPPPARPAFAASRVRRTSRGALVAIWSVVLLVIGVAATFGVMFAVRNGTYARLRDSAKSALNRKSAEPAVAAAPAAPPANPNPSVPATPAAPVASGVPAVSIDSLPKSAVAPDAALVTLPAYAQGHRVFLDGRIVTVSDGSPVTMKCGRHMLKIGSARRPRMVDLACGREVTVQ